MGSIRKRGNVLWIQYYRNGRKHEESARTDKWNVARDMLRQREGKIATGHRISAKMQNLRFDEAAADVLTDYRVNEQASIAEVERRIRKHLEPYFGGRRMTDIGAADVKNYIVHRQAAREMTTTAYTYKRADGRVVTIPERTRTIRQVSNAEINRELAVLKRIFNLAIANEKLLHAPKISLLAEHNRRKGFFEFEQYLAVQRHLPEALQPVIEFAYITGWRVDSEVLPLQWSTVDFDGGVVRLDPDVAKSDEPRAFPLTDDLRALLEDQYRQHQDLARQGHICPFVFFRLKAKGRGGKKSPHPIKRFDKIWKAATIAAGCPGRLVHDLRRTAIRNSVRRHVPERVAMQMCGHETRSVFDRYNIVAQSDLTHARDQLSGLTATKKRQFGDRPSSTVGK